MVRSAAKNHAHVGIVTSPSQYAEVLKSLQQASFDDVARRKLAAAAFEATASYDRAIADYMAGITCDGKSTAAWPVVLTPSF